MERLQCKACGSDSMVPMDVQIEDEQEHGVLGDDQESRFYTCHVCGDNWLSVKETDTEGECMITFVHQMGMSPELKRVAHMETPVLIKDDAVEQWDYYFGEKEVAQQNWEAKLDERRRVLKSVCTN